MDQTRATPARRTSIERVWLGSIAALVTIAALRTITGALEQAWTQDPSGWGNDEVEMRRAVLTSVREALPRGTKIGYVCDEVAFKKAGLDPEKERLVTQYWIAPSVLTWFYADLPLLLVDARAGADRENLIARLPKGKEWQQIATFGTEFAIVGVKPK